MITRLHTSSNGDDTGASATEYALLVTGTAIALIAVTQAYGDALFAALNGFATTLF